MSYTRKRPQPLSAELEYYLQQAKGILGTSKVILEDPALPEVTAIVLELHKMEQPKVRPGAPPPPKVPGIGLKNAVKPLKAYRYVMRNKWVLPVAALAILGLPFVAGYMTGKRRRT